MTAEVLPQAHQDTVRDPSGVEPIPLPETQVPTALPEQMPLIPVARELTSVQSSDSVFVRSAAFDAAVKEGRRQDAINILGQSRNTKLEDPDSTEYHDLMAKLTEPVMRRESFEAALQRGDEAAVNDLLSSVEDATAENGGKEYNTLLDRLGEYRRGAPVVDAAQGLKRAIRFGNLQMQTLILDTAWERGKETGDPSQYQALVRQMVGGNEQAY